MSERDYLQEARQIARAFGGTCLSDSIPRVHGYAQWRCREGHEWRAVFKSVKAGHWCRTCATQKQAERRRLKVALPLAQRLARSRGGTCLSEDLRGAKELIRWRCAAGHEWRALLYEVRKGSWCKVCHYARITGTLEEAQAAARGRGGQCLSDYYRNKREPMRWRCADGHEWTAAFGRVNAGSWCRACFVAKVAGKHLTLKDGLQQAQRVAHNRGGKCLSERYVTATAPLDWQCANGHRWRAAFGDICKGTWCPECGPGLRERLCRRVFEELLGKPFPRIRPSWLFSARGGRMEFDGYCEALQVAFEHHGEQHYRRVEHFQRGEESLARRREDDARRRALSVERGVLLIEIPYDVPAEKLSQWIAHELQTRGYSGPLRPVESVRLRDYVTDESLERLREVARRRGGECLSEVWLGRVHKHSFRCALGHEWEATAGNVLECTWCPTCKLARIAELRRDPEGLLRMQALARERGGRFLSEVYTSVNDRHRWECAKGHIWEAAPSDVQKGTWCKRCMNSARRGTLERLQAVARERGGACLSESYSGSQVRLRWRCAEGHTWEARPDNVVNRRSWCPICAQDRRGRKVRQTGRATPVQGELFALTRGA